MNWGSVIMIGGVLVLLAVGVGVFMEMAIQFEQHADEIEEIGPPGVTNVGLIAGLFVGFVVGVIIDSVDTYFMHKEYFDKLRERERWKKS